MFCSSRGAQALLLGVSVGALMVASATARAQTASTGTTMIPEITITSEKVEGFTTYDAQEP